MPTIDQILAILTGEKVFDGSTWRSFDLAGVEIPDPEQVLRRGNHGALLYAQAIVRDGPGADDDDEAGLLNEKNNCAILSMIMSIVASGILETA